MKKKDQTQIISSWIKNFSVAVNEEEEEEGQDEL